MAEPRQNGPVDQIVAPIDIDMPGAQVDRDGLALDAGDPAQAKIAIRDARNAALRQKEVLVRFMGEPDGRAWLFDHLRRCGVGRNPFSKDPLVMAMNCGEFNVGQQLMAELQAADIGLYMKMMEEGNG